jgi:ArsR family transcriptional regulator
MKAISNLTRIRMLKAFKKGEKCVRKLEELLGIPPANNSQHLTLLRDCGLVNYRRDDNRICYSLSNKNIAKLIEQAEKSIYKKGGVNLWRLLY